MCQCVCERDSNSERDRESVQSAPSSARLASSVALRFKLKLCRCVYAVCSFVYFARLPIFDIHIHIHNMNIVIMLFKIVCSLVDYFSYL